LILQPNQGLLIEPTEWKACPPRLTKLAEHATSLLTGGAGTQFDEAFQLIYNLLADESIHTTAGGYADEYSDNLMLFVFMIELIAPCNYRFISMIRE